MAKKTALRTFLVAALVLSSVFSFAKSDPSYSPNRILIEKAARRLTLFKDGVVVKTYKVALGKHPVGAKERQGDGKTPEGVYMIDSRNEDSMYHRALHLTYPNGADWTRAKALGASPGGDIMIHGIKNGLGWLGPLHRTRDWTQGCIAVTNSEIDELWGVALGTQVEIRP